MWKWVKVPKGIALLAFFLPWMTVSCSGTPLATASGIGLAFGRLSPAAGGMAGSSPPSGGGEISIWLVLAIMLIVAGFAATFLKPVKTMALAVAATSIASLVLIWAGTAKYSKAAILAEAAKKNADSPQAMDQTAAQMIQIDWHLGFWLTLLALAVAAVMAWLAYSGKDADVLKNLGGGGSSAAPAEAATPPEEPPAA